ncbi:MAG: PilZ domain-containing protein, partial [Proteobacteria bacterium]|nr:PilZ domain-containing protein [Pseudomonadota bacterium]
MHRSTQSDRRAFGRRQSFIHALARIPGRAAEGCIVKNFSDGGALIEFPVEFVQPPQKVRLCIDALGIDAECEVRRHEGKLLGVRFL